MLRPHPGQVSLPRSVTVGYLPQEAAGSASGSVLAEALSGFDAVWALEREMEDVAHALETTPDDALTHRYGVQFATSDEADAYALARMAMQLHGAEEPATAFQREAIDVVLNGKPKPQKKRKG